MHWLSIFTGTHPTGKCGRGVQAALANSNQLLQNPQAFPEPHEWVKNNLSRFSLRRAERDLVAAIVRTSNETANTAVLRRIPQPSLVVKRRLG